MEDFVSKATKAAIRHAKYRKSPKVNTNDLLVGILQVISRFDIIQIGHLTIDFQDFNEHFENGVKHSIENASTRKVAYSCSVNDLFEKAAHIAQKDTSPKVELVHLLVAFADENNGLMAQLKEKYNFSGKEWRVALANWQFISPQKERIDSEIDGHSNTATYSVEKQLFSPDEAADFLSVHVQTIRGYIRMGKLPALRLAGERALRIKREDLLGLLEPFKPDET